MAYTGRIRKVVAEDIEFGTEPVQITRADGTTVEASQVNLSHIPTSDGRSAEIILKSVGYSVSEFPGLVEAVSAIGTKEAVLIIDKEVELNQSLTVPDNICLHFTRGGKITVTAGNTLIIGGSIVAGLWQIFSGLVDLSSNKHLSIVLPEWYGAVGDGLTNDTTAIQQAINTNKLVFLSSKTYLVDSLYLYSNAKLKGVSSKFGGTKIKCIGDALFPITTQNVNSNNKVSGILIEDIIFEGNGTNSFLSYELDAYSLGWCIFHRIKVQNFNDVVFKQTGIHIYQSGFYNNKSHVFRGSDALIESSFFNTALSAADPLEPCVKFSALSNSIFCNNYVTGGEPENTVRPIALVVEYGSGNIITNNFFEYSDECVILMNLTSGNKFTCNKLNYGCLNPNTYSSYIAVINSSNNIIEFNSFINVQSVDSSSKYIHIGGEVSNGNIVKDNNFIDSEPIYFVYSKTKNLILENHPSVKQIDLSTNKDIHSGFINNTITNIGADTNDINLYFDSTGSTYRYTPQRGDYFLVKRVDSGTISIVDTDGVNSTVIFTVDDTTAQLVKVVCYKDGEFVVEEIS